eukprot:1718218-Amphidinium_carterae.1
MDLCDHYLHYSVFSLRFCTTIRNNTNTTHQFEAWKTNVVDGIISYAIACRISSRSRCFDESLHASDIT